MATTGSHSVDTVRRKKRSDSLMGCYHPRVNSLWSIWYCTMAIAFQIYIIVCSIQRFMRYIVLSWPAEDQPYFELNAYVGCIGAAVVLLPFFIVAAIFKVGNYSNDGCKLGNEHDDNAIYQNLKRKTSVRWLKTVWRHGGPTAPFLHICSAFCLLMPRVLIQAQLIRHEFLPKADLWRTDLDFVVTHKDRLVALSFLSIINETELWTQEVADQQKNDSDDNHSTQFPGMALVSAEFINYMLALLVYTVRYPSVFWKVNKWFGLVLSFQLMVTSVQQVLAFTSFSVLYKIYVFGAKAVLFRFSPLLLNVPLSLLLFLLYNIMLTLSGTILYIYGLQKYRDWEECQARKSHITWREESRRLWGYIPQLSAFLALLIIALTASPLMYDCTLVYCGSLDGVILAGVTGTIVHLLLWILMWLSLTIKHKWKFSNGRMKKCPLTCNGQIAKLGNNIEMKTVNTTKEPPLLVIENGQTYQVREMTFKKAIINLAVKSNLSEKSGSPSDDEEVYWLKPKIPIPSETKESPENDRITRRKGNRKSKVTFEERLLNSSPTKRTKSLTKSPKFTGKLKKQNVKLEELSDSNSEDGDYATLREMVVVKGDDHKTPTHTRLCPLEDTENFDISSRPLLDDGDYELLLEEEIPLRNQVSAPVIVHHSVVSTTETPVDHSRRTSVPVPIPVPDSQNTKASTSCDDSNRQNGGNLTPRSGSVSESSTTPEKGGSDSSSGVHSNSSMCEKRATSLENVANIGSSKSSWKSMSLQRNVAPLADDSYKLGISKKSTPTEVNTIKPENGIYLDPYETTLVIRRKQSDEIEHKKNNSQEPFGRATNMRMTSFTDHPGFTATPEQLDMEQTSPRKSGMGHLGGITIMKGDSVNPYSKPTIIPSSLKVTTPVLQHQRRDSANYSMASSGESDHYTSQS